MLPNTAISEATPERVRSPQSPHDIHDRVDLLLDFGDALFGFVYPHAGMLESHVFEDMMQLVDWVRDGTPSIAGAAHARHVIDIIEVGCRAAQTGQTQELRDDVRAAGSGGVVARWYCPNASRRAGWATRNKLQDTDA
jgi:hypothetical protein